MAQEEKKYWFYLLLATVIIGFLNFMTLRQGIDGWGDDFALYIDQARNWHDGTLGKLTQEQIFLVQNSDTVFSPVLYPCGYPLLLLPFYHFFGLNYEVFKIITFLFFLVAFPLFFALFKRFLPFSWAFFATLLIGTQTFFWQYKVHILSELPYIFFVYTSLYLFTQKNTYRHAFLLGVCVFMAVFVRSQGWALFMAVFVNMGYIYWKEKRLYFRYFCLFCLTFGGLYALQSIFLPTSDYSQAFQSTHYLQQIVQNIKDFPLSLLLFFPSFLGVFLLPFAVLGIWKSLKEPKMVGILAFLLINGLLLIFYPAGSGGQRFVMSLYPIIVFFAFLGLQSWQFRYNYTLLVPVFLWQAKEDVSLLIQDFKAKNLPLNGVLGQKEQEMMLFLQKSVKNNEVVLFEKARAIRHFTGLRVIEEDSPKDAQSKHSNWFVSAEKEGLNPTFFDLQFENQKYKVYRIK